VPNFAKFWLSGIVIHASNVILIANKELKNVNDFILKVAAHQTQASHQLPNFLGI
jgi:hypothetical protein